MHQHLNVRGPVLFALVFAVTAFILSLLVLLAGSTPSFLLESYIVLYDTSSLAAAASTTQASNSTNITTTANNNNDTTKIYDWYAFYYLSICYGSWTNDTTISTPTSPSPWPRTKTNISCTNQPPGYHLSLANYLPAGIASSSSSSLVDDNDVDGYSYSYTIHDRDPAAYVATWLAGVISVGMAAVVLPFLLWGRVHVNGYVLFVLILSALAFLTGAILASLDTTTTSLASPASPAAIAAQHSSPLSLGLTWATAACALLALGAEGVEWNLQRWTPVGERVDGRGWRRRRKSGWRRGERGSASVSAGERGGGRFGFVSRGSGSRSGDRGGRGGEEEEEEEGGGREGGWG